MHYLVTLCVVALSAGAMGDVVCPLPGNNETFYADPSSCSHFFECFAGKRTRMVCPGNLLWNDKAKVCDYAENVDCHEDPSAPTEPPVTTIKPSTSSGWTPDPNCPYPSDIITYDYYPTNCSKFYECDHGKRYLMDCPAGLLWNHIKNYCDYPENVDCTRSTSTTEHFTGTTPLNTVCNGKPDGTLIADEADCSKYYECLANSAVEFTCPAPLLWNDKVKTCDYASNVDCNVTPDPTGTVPPTTVDPICYGQADGSFWEDPTSCSKYYECVSGKAVSFECPGNTLWNEEIKTCDFPNHVNCTVTTTAASYSLF